MISDWTVHQKVQLVHIVYKTILATLPFIFIRCPFWCFFACFTDPAVEEVIVVLNRCLLIESTGIEGWSCFMVGYKRGRFLNILSLVVILVVSRSEVDILLIVFNLVVLVASKWVIVETDFVSLNCRIFLILFLFTSETDSEIVECRFIGSVPFLKLRDGCLQVGHKRVDRAMIFHHLFVMDSALVGVFHLDKHCQSCKERPGKGLIFLFSSLNFQIKGKKDSVFNEVLFSPMKAFGGSLLLGRALAYDFKRFCRE